MENLAQLSELCTLAKARELLNEARAERLCPRFANTPVYGRTTSPSLQRMDIYKSVQKFKPPVQKRERLDVDRSPVFADNKASPSTQDVGSAADDEDTTLVEDESSSTPEIDDHSTSSSSGSKKSRCIGEDPIRLSDCPARSSSPVSGNSVKAPEPSKDRPSHEQGLQDIDHIVDLTCLDDSENDHKVQESTASAEPLPQVIGELSSGPKGPIVRAARCYRIDQLRWMTERSSTTIMES